MFDTVEQTLRQQHVLFHKNQGITVCSVESPEKGVELAKEILYDLVDKKSVLYLSGGSMQVLYKQLASDEKLSPGAVGMIDERFGEPMHDNSNEKMVSGTGFLRYLTMKDIPFYPVLQKGKNREEVASLYDEKVRSLQATYQKHVGLIGIGPDGHISSIIPNRKDFHNPWFDGDRQNLFVSEFNDSNSHYKERVGMTFLGLSMLDVLMVLVFGEGKKETLEKVFADGPEEEIPARFFKRPEIAKKTILITDIQV